MVLENLNATTRNILIVDDEEEICILLSYALKKLGFITNYALTVMDGREKLKDLSPDLVLLDVQLPDGSGLSLIPKIKALKSNFVVISAYDDSRQKALNEGAAAFIKKPFNLKQITTSVVELLNTNGL